MEQQNENENEELKITVNENDEITGYAIVGGIEDEISVPYEEVPTNFVENFKPKYYLFKNGDFKVNKNYKPTEEE